MKEEFTRLWTLLRYPFLWTAQQKARLLILAILGACFCIHATPQQPPQQTVTDLKRQNTDLKRQVAELRRKVASLTTQIEALQDSRPVSLASSTLDLQDKCAARGYKDFEDWSFKGKENSDFVAHYSRKLDRCFVQFQNTANEGEFFWRQLFDAYSGKEYGEYAWQQKKDKKYWEVPPFVCHIDTLSGETKYCHSDEEFGALAKIFMEN